MPLPKCVKVDIKDAISRESLGAEDWRFIGQLDTYSGKICGNEERIYTPEVRPLVLAGQIQWLGRLWRDQDVSQSEAWAETERIIKNPKFHCYVMGREPAAFILLDKLRVVLIGVHPFARGLGLASGLLVWASQRGEITAGTFSDNKAAVALYKSLDMELIKSQAVFHK